MMEQRLPVVKAARVRWDSGLAEVRVLANSRRRGPFLGPGEGLRRQRIIIGVFSFLRGHHGVRRLKYRATDRAV